MQFIGELAALGSAFVWAVSMCMVSHFGKNYSARALNFFKNFTALFFVGLACLWSGSFSNMSAKLAIYAMISGVVGLSIADTALFVALKKLGAQLTSAIQTLSPPFTVLIALACLGETLVPKEIQGLIFTVSCVALAIIFSPKSAHLSQELHYRKHKSLGVL